MKFNQMAEALAKMNIHADDASETLPRPISDINPTEPDVPVSEDCPTVRGSQPTVPRDVRGVPYAEPHLPLVPNVNGVVIRYPHLVAFRKGAQLFGYSAGDLPIPRGLIIGESPGPSSDPRLPLFPYPENSTGARLLGYAPVTKREYIGCSMRTNLCPTSWFDEIAEMRVLQLKHALARKENRGPDGKMVRVLLLGKKVMAAWGIESRKKFDYATIFVSGQPLTVGWIPHPSGLNRIYQEEANQMAAGRFVQWVIGARRTP